MQKARHSDLNRTIRVIHVKCLCELNLAGNALKSHENRGKSFNNSHEQNSKFHRSIDTGILFMGIIIQALAREALMNRIQNSHRSVDTGILFMGIVKLILVMLSYVREGFAYG